MLAIAKKINEIVSGWSNYAFESDVIKVMAKRRAVECAKCEHAKKLWVLEFIEDDVKEIEAMACELCKCPLSSKLRSQGAKCEIGLW